MPTATDLRPEDCEVAVAAFPDYPALWNFYNRAAAVGEFAPFMELEHHALQRLFDWNRNRLVLIQVPGLGGEIIAAGAVSLRQTIAGAAGHIDWVLTASAYRRRGFSRRVMLELHDHARKLGADRLKLKSEPYREAARALYLSLGYQLEEGSDRHFFLRLP